MDGDLTPRSELPQPFITAMKTLFDIMDVNKSGMVRFSDIESRWQDDPRKGLPKGVLENLRKVTPSSGFISFGQFCTGLKLCLMKLKSDEINPSDLNNNTSRAPRSDLIRNRPASVPIPNITNNASTVNGRKSEQNQIADVNNPTAALPTSDNSKPISETHKPATGSKVISRSVSSRPVSGISRPNTARVKPNNAIAQRTISMPHLGDKKYSYLNQNNSGSYGFASPPPFIDPPPVKQNQQRNKPESSVPICPPSALNKSGIMTVLQKWRLDKLKENKDMDFTDTENIRNEQVDHGGSRNFPEITSGSSSNILPEAPPKPPRLDGSYKTVTENGQFPSDETVMKSGLAKKNLNRRKEPRRHTLASGIDYNMLKRMKQMEQEKDILVQGLESVDRAKEWYLKQIHTVQDKMKYIGRIGSFVEQSSDVYQERLNFQMARIFEVNQHLSALVESTDKGFPLHMNLALRQPSFFKANNKSSTNDGTVQRLKQQNNLLTEAMSKKSERITQLEREKAALIRELFQARSQHRRESDDNTLM